MWTRWVMAGVVVAATSGAAFAADLAGYQGYPRPYRHVEVVGPVTVVPDCKEQDPIVLGCVPRATLPDGPAYAEARRQYLELGRPVRPYMQLFTWSR